MYIAAVQFKGGYCVVASCSHNAPNDDLTACSFGLPDIGKNSISDLSTSMLRINRIHVDSPDGMIGERREIDKK